MIDWKNVDNSFKDEDGIKVIPGGSPMAVQEDGTVIPTLSVRDIHPVFLASDEPIIEKQE